MFGGVVRSVKKLGKYRLIGGVCEEHSVRLRNFGFLRELLGLGLCKPVFLEKAVSYSAQKRRGKAEKK